MTDLTTTADTLAIIEHQLMTDPRLASVHTRRAYRVDLRAFEAYRAGRPLTKLLVESYAVSLRRRDLSPNTINRALASVRWWARRLVDIAYEEPMPRAQRDEIVTQSARVATVRDVGGQRETRGRHIAGAELAALLSVCQRDPGPAGARDGAIFALAWCTGLRRSEICALNLADLKPDAEMVVVNVLRGKGNKARRAYLPADGQRWLHRWLAVRGPQPGALFCPINKGGKLALPRGIMPNSLRHLLDRRVRETGLKDCTSWHDFRRSFAGNLLDAGVDLATAQRLMGHSSPTTTSLYDRRPEETRMAAVRRIQMPNL